MEQCRQPIGWHLLRGRRLEPISLCARQRCQWWSWPRALHRPRLALWALEGQTTAGDAGSVFSGWNAEPCSFTKLPQRTSQARPDSTSLRSGPHAYCSDSFPRKMLHWLHRRGPGAPEEQGGPQAREGGTLPTPQRVLLSSESLKSWLHSASGPATKAGHCSPGSRRRPSGPAQA